MDDSNTSDNSKTASREPLGMNSFGEKERQQFGQNMRIAMACIEGKSEPTPNKAMPADASLIGLRLKSLSQDINSSLADLIELLVRFDDLEGWKESGAKHCAAWMNFELGISLRLGWEYRRVGRKLRLLPTTTALFRVGKLTWSKVRLITRVAEHADDLTMFDFEKDIRNDQASFDKVRKLSPTRYRFRVIDAEGRDISTPHSSGECTRVHSNEPVSSDYEYDHGHHRNGVAESSVHYHVNVHCRTVQHVSS